MATSKKSSQRKKAAGRAIAKREPVLVGRLRDMLRAMGARPIRERKMFGSDAFMVRGHLCVAGREERMLCRIDPEQHEKAVARKGCTAVRMRGRLYRGYLHIDANALTSRRSLESWVRQALAYNKTLPAKSSKA